MRGFRCDKYIAITAMLTFALLIALFYFEIGSTSLYTHLRELQIGFTGVVCNTNLSHQVVLRKMPKLPINQIVKDQLALSRLSLRRAQHCSHRVFVGQRQLVTFLD